jgi:hypothetical protein
MKYEHWAMLQATPPWEPPKELKKASKVKFYKSYDKKELIGKRLMAYKKAKANFIKVEYSISLSKINNLLTLNVGEGFFSEFYRCWGGKSKIKGKKFKVYNHGSLIVRVE